MLWVRAGMRAAVTLFFPLLVSETSFQFTITIIPLLPFVIPLTKDFFFSLGWVGVTAGQGMPVTLQAYTPGGQGCVMRSPSLLKYAINLRGRRKTGRAGYHVQGLDSEHHPRKKK